MNSPCQTPTPSLAAIFVAFSVATEHRPLATASQRFYFCVLVQSLVQRGAHLFRLALFQLFTQLNLDLLEGRLAGGHMLVHAEYHVVGSHLEQSAHLSIFH